MTLLIALLLINHMQLPWYWYLIACVLWIIKRLTIK